MKYLIAVNKEQEIDECLYDIADFLWNNGNEVCISSNHNNKLDHQNFVEYCDWVVLMVHGDGLPVSFFERERDRIEREFSLEKGNSEKLMLVFSIHGVYSNAIPYPHKIFHLDGLDQNGLKQFFSWCKSLNLFDNQRQVLVQGRIDLIV